MPNAVPSEDSSSSAVYYNIFPVWLVRTSLFCPSCGMSGLLLSAAALFVRGTVFSRMYRSVLIQRSAVNLLLGSESLYLCSSHLSGAYVLFIFIPLYFNFCPFNSARPQLGMGSLSFSENWKPSTGSQSAGAMGKLMLFLFLRDHTHALHIVQGLKQFFRYFCQVFHGVTWKASHYSVMDRNTCLK